MPDAPKKAAEQRKLEEFLHRAVESVQSAKCLTYKHKDLSWIPGSMLGAITHDCNPRAGETEIRGVPQVHWPARPAKLVSSRFCERPWLKELRYRGLLRWFSL